MNDNKKGKIIRLSKLLARKKRVAYYIEYLKDSINYSIDCEFEINGNINITVKHSTMVKKAELEDAIRNAINPHILQKVQRFLEQSGYTFQIFNSFNQDNIEFKDITLVSILEVRKNIKLKNYTSCLSSVFTLIDDSLSTKQDELRLKYKRVSNYNELDSIDSFINEMRRNDESPETIIRKLYQNFSIEEDEARARFASWASQINVETDLFENKAVTIRTNTGFPISITRNNADFTTTIKTTNINDIGYIHFISIYIDSLLRLITNKTSTEVPAKTITDLCKGKAIIETAPIQDIVTHKIRFREDRDKTSSFLELFGEAEDEDDETSESKTGAFEGVEFGEIEFGEIDSFGSSKSNKSSSEDIGFATESKEGTTSEVDFDEVDFGDFGDFATPESPRMVRQLSEIGKLPAVVERKQDISPSSDISSDAEVNLKGLQLKGTNNIFMKKMEAAQPELFLKKGIGRYNAYSRACPSQYNKHPMILTGKEKKYIDTQDKEFGTKSYDEHITYGTGDTKYHYICPRFWCLSDKNGKSRSLSLEEINSGTCGGWDALIPEGASTVPDGKRIIEFTDTRMHKSKTKTKNLLVYKPMFPSFMDKSKHPDNLCIPCCFTRPTTFDPKDTKWIVRTNKKKKEEYYNTETKEVRSKYPLIQYDDMYKPIGKGPGGPGPNYKVDENGNIIMDSIVGEKEVRDAPADARKKAYNTCNQSINQTKLSVKEKTLKIDDAPLLEAWPLRTGQIGYLPLPLQKFLGYNCRKICQESLNDHNLKLKQPCLLHKGMEEILGARGGQSFLACIADFYNDAFAPGYESKGETLSATPSMTVKQLKTIITKQLTLDRFIELQNGDLINIFSNPTDEFNITPYKTSVLYKFLGKSNESDIYFKKVVSAFINFGKYILDDTIVIDYKYLWDFVAKPISPDGSGLFRDGINMIILKSPEDDITSKIELICPSNYYSGQVYDINRKAVILYTRNGYFEPIYKYTKMRKRVYAVTKLFDIRNIMRELPNVGAIIKHIWTDLTVKCKPLPSMPAEYNQKYDFHENLGLNEIFQILQASKSVYKFKTQIANYSSKTIGILLQKGEDSSDTIIIPCLPSALNISMPTIFDNTGRNLPLNSYTDSFNRLTYLKKISGNKLLCKPKFKLVNDSVIIGIITETNQVIPTIPEAYQTPVGGIEADGIGVIIKNISPDPFNYLHLDNQILTNKTIDEERVRKVRNIRLESHFYNVFRNMIRITLAYYENKKIKDEILNTIMSPIIPYYTKLQLVERHIKEIMQPYILFVRFDNSALAKMNEIEVCLNMVGDRCNQKEYCSFVPGAAGEPGKCQMMLPKINLISGSNNEMQYFARVANELIKFDRIRTFIFVPKTFLSFQNISYNLNDNEIILLEDLLYGDYFEDLVTQEINPYIRNTNTWGITEPAESVPYANTFNMSYDLKDQTINQCIVTDSQNKRLMLGRWAAAGFQEYSILEFKTSNNCSWELIKDILNIHQPAENHTLQSILQTLVESYKTLSRSETFNAILILLKQQGKKDQVRSIQNGVPLTDVITPTNYYLSTLDFFLLANYYNIPLIVLCRTKIPTLFSQYISFLKESPTNCFIIFAGAYANAETNHSPIYALLSRDESIQLSIPALGDVFTKITGLNITSLQTFIERTKLAKRLGKRKPKVTVNISSATKNPRVKKIKTKVRLG